MAQSVEGQSAEAPPPAGADRRFYAFVLDRLLVWSGYAAVAWASYALLIDQDRVAAGVAVVVGAALVAWLVLSVVLGLWGATPGKLMLGLRVTADDDAAPIGLALALVRTAILGVATLPTLGLGAAALAWTALADPSGRRRGWHDRRVGSEVVDVRPPAVVTPAAELPRPVVNLTAARLVPASPTPPQTVPEQVAAPVTPRQRLGWPLVGSPPRTDPPPRTSPPPPSSPPPPAVTAWPGRGPVTSARWRVSFDTEESFVVEGLTLVGRRPEARSGEPVRHLVSLPSDDLSLSKTHAQFQVVPDGALVVMDRGSTNGSILIRSGATRRLSGGRPTTLRHGDRVRFGDREMTVVLEE